jgi:hypothetical protein
MKNSILLALFGITVVAGVPAYAGTANFDFTTGSPVGSGNDNSNLSSYSVSSGGVTATVVSFFATGTSTPSSGLSGPVNSNGTTNSNAPQVGEYNGAGLGVCENQNNPNCEQPNHQINDGPDDTTNTSGQTTKPGGTDSCTTGGSNDCNFEFVLIQFTTPVSLSQIQLGNYETTGSLSADPFLATYWTSATTSGITAVEEGLAGTTVGNVANVDGFSAEQQSTCTTGQAALGGGGNQNGSFNDNCAVDGNGVENLNTTAVSYLLIGASVQSANAGNEFFKIQDLSFKTSTPEPATFGLIGLSLAGLGFLRKKRNLN